MRSATLTGWFMAGGRRARAPQDPRELVNLCPKHHDLATHRGYTTIDNRDGTWDLHAPANAPPEEEAA